MRKTKLLFVISLFWAALVVSCNTSIEEPSPTFDHSGKSSRKIIDKRFLEFDFSKYKIIPLWDLAVTFKNEQTIEVPFTIENKEGRRTQTVYSSRLGF